MAGDGAGRHTRVLLFDLGGVLIENAGLERLAALCPQPLPEAELRRRWLASPSVRGFERGEMGAGEFASRFVAEWRLALSPDDFLAEFAAWPKGLYAGAAALLDRLAPRYRLACFTNSNAIHCARFPDLRARVDGFFSSHELGLVKPDLPAFRRVLELLGGEPTEVAFFDDSAPNVEAAAAVGMHAHHVVGFDALAATLRRLGIDA
jgi:putative hydrolase of the HAD superfamily